MVEGKMGGCRCGALVPDTRRGECPNEGFLFLEGKGRKS